MSETPKYRGDPRFQPFTKAEIEAIVRGDYSCCKSTKPHPAVQGPEAPAARLLAHCPNCDRLVKLEAAYRQSEQAMLRRLSEALTGGKAATWEEIEQAALASQALPAEAPAQVQADYDQCLQILAADMALEPTDAPLPTPAQPLRALALCLYGAISELRQLRASAVLLTAQEWDAPLTKEQIHALAQDIGFAIDVTEPKEVLIARFEDAIRFALQSAAKLRTLRPPTEP